MSAISGVLKCPNLATNVIYWSGCDAATSRSQHLIGNHQILSQNGRDSSSVMFRNAATIYFQTTCAATYSVARDSQACNLTSLPAILPECRSREREGPWFGPHTFEWCKSVGDVRLSTTDIKLFRRTLWLRKLPAALALCLWATALY